MSDCIHPWAAYADDKEGNLCCGSCGAKYIDNKWQPAPETIVVDKKADLLRRSLAMLKEVKGGPYGCNYCQGLNCNDCSLAALIKALEAVVNNG